MHFQGFPQDVVEVALLKIRDTYCAKGKTRKDYFSDARVKKIAKSICSRPRPPWFPTTSGIEFIFDKCDTCAEVAVLGNLIGRSKPDGSNDKPPSKKGIALDCRMSEKKVRQVLDDLESKGVIIMNRILQNTKRKQEVITYIRILY